MIDTGATHSIINPGICNPKWSSAVNLHLKTLKNIVPISEKVRIPLFVELGDPKQEIEMLVCKFHDFFDGILGNNVLRQLNVKIDYEKSCLLVGGKSTPIHFQQEENEEHYSFKKNGNYIVNIPVRQENGLAYTAGKSSANGKITIHEGVYEVSNFKMEAVVQVLADSESSVHFNTQETEPVTEQNFHIIEDREDRPLLEQIRMNHLNPEESAKLSNLINQFPNIFYREDSDLTFTNATKHEIRTTNSTPIAVKSYRYPYVHKNEVRTQIKEMLEKGIIRPSKSPYSAPVWIVPKKLDASGRRKWRLVIDYRKLNDITVDDKYPLPNMDEILEKLGKCQYFTTLDLAKGFHQIEIAPEDVHKTAFNVEGGHYEFVRMPFGLKTAPATFQRLMNEVLSDYINKICLVYLDDIIIFSSSLTEHIESLTKIFRRLKDVNLKVQLDKCEFLKREAEFLGHIVTEQGIKPNPNKIECVEKFPIPKTPRQIKQFLGLTGYYRKFIRDYSKIAKPMTKFLKKDAKVDVSDREYIDSFETLKRLLISEPILKYPDFDKTFTVSTDASQFAIGAVLSQEDHPICYASRTLNNHEENYSTVEKELLAVVWATKHFRPYLFGRKFLIETDHKPLQWLFSIKDPNSKLVRWRLKLSEFDYDIKYRKGTSNGNADALSRIIINHTELETPLIKDTGCPINFYKRQIIIKKSNSGSLKLKNTKVFKNCRKTIYVKNLDCDTATLIIKNHFDPEKTNAILIEDEAFYNNFLTSLREYFNNNSGKFKIIRCRKLLRDVPDENELVKHIEEEHLKNNHRGINENFIKLKEEIYHPNLKERITKFINNCEICNLEKYDRHPVKQKFKITETPNGPREIVHIDVFYSLDKTLFLTLIDKFSKYAQAIKIKGRTWTEFKRATLQYISTIGHFKKLIVDNELGFKALPLRQFLDDQNIEIHFTSNNNHTSNSDVERFHNTINEHLRLLRHDPNKNTDSVEDKILKIISFYNNSVHSTTGKKPLDFFLGNIKPEEYPAIREKIIKNKEKTINTLNKNREDVQVTSGPIFLKEVRGGKNHAKFRKVNANIVDNDHVIIGSGHRYYKSHIKRSKKYQDNNNPSIKAKTKDKRRDNNRTNKLIIPDNEPTNDTDNINPAIPGPSTTY